MACRCSTSRTCGRWSSTSQQVGEHVKDLSTEYGNVASASIGAIQRGLLTLEERGGGDGFGEPTLDIHDLLKVDENDSGVINVLAAEKLVHGPALCSTFLIWLAQPGRSPPGSTACRGFGRLPGRPGPELRRFLCLGVRFDGDASLIERIDHRLCILVAGAGQFLRAGSQ